MSHKSLVEIQLSLFQRLQTYFISADKLERIQFQILFYCSHKYYNSMAINGDQDDLAT